MNFFLDAIGGTLRAVLGYQVFLQVPPHVALASASCPARSQTRSEVMPHGKVAQPTPNSARTRHAGLLYLDPRRLIRLGQGTDERQWATDPWRRQWTRRR
jgi:hypothetical protein